MLCTQEEGQPIAEVNHEDGDVHTGEEEMDGHRRGILFLLLVFCLVKLLPSRQPQAFCCSNDQ